MLKRSNRESELRQPHVGSGLGPQAPGAPLQNGGMGWLSYHGEAKAGGVVLASNNESTWKTTLSGELELPLPFPDAVSQ